MMEPLATPSTSSSSSFGSSSSSSSSSSSRPALLLFSLLSLTVTSASSTQQHVSPATVLPTQPSSSSDKASSPSSIPLLGRHRSQHLSACSHVGGGPPSPFSSSPSSSSSLCNLLTRRGGSTSISFHPPSPSIPPRNRTAEWEEDAAWLTNQVLIYQAHLALSSEALGKRHAVVGPTPFDYGFKHEEKHRPPLEIAQASPSQPYDCRIHGEVEVGAKLVAPCLCRGTGKWMWFADMNRRRRRDPVSSRVCGTCHARMDYQAYQQFGSSLTQLVSWPLDHALAFRGMLLTVILSSMFFLFLEPVSVLVIRLLTSSLFWRQHSLWSRVVYGPLPLKIVMYKYVGQLLWSYFLRMEDAVRETLAEAESVLLERALPVTVGEEYSAGEGEGGAGGGRGGGEREGEEEY